jgi:hypothetical protein
MGRLVKTIISPFGYEPAVQCEMLKGKGSKYFTSTASYRKTGTATMKIVRTIVELEESEGGK